MKKFTMSEFNKKVRSYRSERGNSILGKRMAENRIRMNLTQWEVAQKINVTKSSISSWETGAASPVRENIEKLANLFGVSIEELTKDWSPPMYAPVYRNRGRPRGKLRSTRVEIGNNLARARKLSGLTQSQLSLAIGVHPALISNWERTQSIPANREFLEKISGVLGISVESLLDKTDFSEDAATQILRDGGIASELLAIMSEVREASRAIQGLESRLSKLLMQAQQKRDRQAAG